VRVVEVVPTLKINVFRQLPRAYRFFVTFFYDFCRVPTDDFLKNHDFEHGFEYQHDANFKKKRVQLFCDFERSHQKSRFSSSCHELPRACGRSRSNADNQCFSAIASGFCINDITSASTSIIPFRTPPRGGAIRVLSSKIC